MATLILTHAYLEPSQRAALRKRAKARGTRVAEELRSAVDAYLAAPTAEQVELLDAASLEVKKHLGALADELTRVNARLDATIAQLRRLRAKSPVARQLDR